MDGDDAYIMELLVPCEDVVARLSRRRRDACGLVQRLIGMEGVRVAVPTPTPIAAKPTHGNGELHSPSERLEKLDATDEPARDAEEYEGKPQPKGGRPGNAPNTRSCDAFRLGRPDGVIVRGSEKGGLAITLPSPPCASTADDIESLPRPRPQSPHAT